MHLVTSLQDSWEPLGTKSDGCEGLLEAQCRENCAFTKPPRATGGSREGIISAWDRWCDTIIGMEILAVYPSRFKSYGDVSTTYALVKYRPDGPAFEIQLEAYYKQPTHMPVDPQLEQTGDMAGLLQAERVGKYGEYIRHHSENAPNHSDEARKRAWAIDKVRKVLRNAKD